MMQFRPIWALFEILGYLFLSIHLLVSDLGALLAGVFKYPNINLGDFLIQHVTL